MKGLFILLFWIIGISAFSQVDNHETSEKWADVRASGIRLFQAGEYVKAINQFEKAIELAKVEFGISHLNYASSLNNLAAAYWSMGMFNEAEPLYLESLTVRESNLGNEHPDCAATRSNLGLLYNSMGLFEKSEKMHLTAKNIREKTIGKEHSDYASSTQNLANLYYDMGLYEKAEPLYIEALSIREKTVGRDHFEYATTSANLANLYFKIGNYSKSEWFQLQALNIRKRILGVNHPHYARSLNDLANLYFTLGFYEKAESMYKEAIGIREETLGKNHPDYAHSLANLGMLYNSMSRFKESVSLYTEVNNIRKKIYGKDHPQYAHSIFSLANSYMGMGYYKIAESLYLEADTIWHKTLGENHPDYAALLNNLGRLYLNICQFDRADSVLGRAGSVWEIVYGNEHPNYVESLNNRAILSWNQYSYERAKSFWIESNRLTHIQIKKYFQFLSESEKESFYRILRDRFEQFTSFSLETEPTLDLHSYLYNNQIATKGLLFNNNIKVQERILKSGDESLISLFTALRSKRELLVKAYQLTIDERKAKNIDIIELENEINGIEKELSMKSALYGIEHDVTQFTWQTVQKQLKKNEAAIEITRFRKYGSYKTVTDSSNTALPQYTQRGLTDTVHYAALIVTAKLKSPEPVLLKNGNDLEGKILKYYKNSIQFKLDDTLSYNHFWKPIADVLKKHKIKKVYLSLDGVYNSVNLSTLQNPINKEYIADEVEIRILTNTKDLVTPKKNERKSKATNASLFGYPAYSGQDTSVIERKERSTLFYIDSVQRFFDGHRITALPGTKTEVQALTNLLTTNQVKANEYLDHQASEEEVKRLNNPDILHIATHGFFLQDLRISDEQTFAGFDVKKVKQNPLLRSGLLLANSQRSLSSSSFNSDTEDGILTAYEAMNLNLDETDIVVLSACETGLGEIRNGEGVYGLQRAFQTAGAKSVLMSLWRVDDNATKELMTLFYKNWLKNQNKWKAFKQAQVQLKNKYKYPYYWGAFVLVGN